MLLEPNIYVTAALLGAACYVGLGQLEVGGDTALWISVSAAFGLRAMAILFKLRLPSFGSS